MRSTRHGIGVHPVAGAPRVQQALVGGGPVDLLVAQERRALALDLRERGPEVPPGRCSSSAVTRHPTRPAGSARSGGCCSIGTCSSCLWASDGSPGPKLTAGMPRPVKRATSVQPNFGSDLAADRLDERLRRGPSSPGSAPGAESVTVISKPSKKSRDVGERLLLGPIRGEPVVHGDHGLVREHVGGDPAADQHGVEALVVLQPVDHRSAGVVLLEPAQHLARPGGSR